MLGCVTCWAFAISLMFKLHTINGDYLTSVLFALAFIFLGTISKAVSVYRDIHGGSTIVDVVNETTKTE